MIDTLFPILMGLLAQRVARAKGFEGPMPMAVVMAIFCAAALVGQMVYSFRTYSTYELDDSWEAFWFGAVAGGSISGIVVSLLLLLRKEDGRQLERRSPHRLIGVSICLLAVVILAATGGGAVLGAIVLTGVGVATYRYGLRLRAPAGEEVLSKDVRAPVLFLRTFASDSHLSRRFPFHLPQDLNGAGQSVSQGMTFEELLAPVVDRDIGPFVAFGDPKESLPLLGASKMVVGSAEWKSAFATLATRSGCILVLEGLGEGLKYELDWVRQNISWRRVFIITLPKKKDRETLGLNRAWTGFATDLRDLGYRLPQDDPGEGCVLAFNDEWVAGVVVEKASHLDQYTAGCVQCLIGT